MKDTVVTRTLVVVGPQGMHARPAQLFAEAALQFKSDIELTYQDRRCDAKSILEILTLGADVGAEIVLEARGEDAEQAADALVEIASNIFGDEDS